MHEFEVELVGDLLQKFGRSFYDIGGPNFSAKEALFCVAALIGDTTSRYGTARAGWTRPASREELALMDLTDVTIMANGGKKTLGRPWTDTSRTSDEQALVAEGRNFTPEQVERYLEKRAAAQRAVDEAAAAAQALPALAPPTTTEREE